MKPIEWTPAIIDRWRTDRGEFRYTVVGHGEPPEDMPRQGGLERMIEWLEQRKGGLWQNAKR